MSRSRRPSSSPAPAIHHQVRDLLGAALSTLRQGGVRLAALYVGSQLAVALIVVPITRWIFDEALRTAGVVGLDMTSAFALAARPGAMGLIVGVAVVAFIATLLQLLVVSAGVHVVRSGQPLTPRTLWATLRGVPRRLARLGTVALLPYLFLILPLAGFGFIALLSRAIEIPRFVTGELTKTVTGTIIVVVFFVLVGALSARLSLTLPLLATTDIRPASAMRRSLQLTRGRDLALTLAVMLVFIATSVVVLVVTLVFPAPVMLTDAFAPGASLPVAAFFLAIAELIGIAAMGTAVVAILAMLVRILEVTGEVAQPAAVTATSARPKILVPMIVLALGCGALGASAVPALTAMDRAPAAIASAHRGYTAAAVENTIEALDAARAEGTDVVEMDVMQTADGRFVVMHDADLTRLTGQGVRVGDLTFAEATAMTVSDGRGASGALPGLTPYVLRAAEIDQQLLIEVKLHGGETPDIVELLLQELDDAGVTERNIYHSLDGGVVEQLKLQRPGLTVGYTMALAGTAVPVTNADFLVVEQASYTRELTDEAHRAGLGMWVWTANDRGGIRQLLRDGVDGIISDHVNVVIAERDDMLGDPGLAPVLYDAITRFVRVF